MKSISSVWWQRQQNKIRQRNKWVRAARLICDYRGMPTIQCSLCGEQDQDMLCIDHVNGDGHVGRVNLRSSHGHNYKFYDEINTGERHPSEAQVLCYNHHAKKTKEEQDYKKGSKAREAQMELPSIAEILARK